MNFRAVKIRKILISGYENLRFQGFQSFKVSRFQSFRGFRVSRVSKFQGFRVSGVSGFQGIQGFQRFKDLKIPRVAGDFGGSRNLNVFASWYKLVHASFFITLKKCDFMIVFTLKKCNFAAVFTLKKCNFKIQSTES